MENKTLKNFISTTVDSSLESSVSDCVSELMNAAVSFHKLHLKITNIGSYAGHKALNEIYDVLPDLADNLAEQFQGVNEKILNYQNNSLKILNSVEDAVSYLKELYAMINNLQSKLPYSEIVNELDNAKSQINSTKYKLLFLK